MNTCYCGTTFDSAMGYSGARMRGNPRAYCSRRCQGRAKQQRRPLREQRCLGCGTPYMSRQRGIVRRTTCSTCRPDPRIGQSCPVRYGLCACGQAFVVRGSRASCSTTCARERQLAKARDYNRHRPGAASPEDLELVPGTCLSCGTEFSAPRYRHRFYCSPRCFKTFRKARATVIGGTSLRMIDLPPEVLETVRLYRQLNKELQKKWQPRP
jgi:hypothetical protein